ncbi:MAG: hypothetical protein KDA67_15205 [Rhodobacteraceae bacterium]|nr:hypothetical protein [Paracoccaceae bacterium]
MLASARRAFAGISPTRLRGHQPDTPSRASAPNLSPELARQARPGLGAVRFTRGGATFHS